MRLAQASESSGHTERARRAQRILDAAGELLIAWGYRRITIEEVARRAGVGKGTVYLHFRTKESLFLTVLLRSQLAMGERIVAGMRSDPANTRLGSTARAAYLALHEDPIAHALVTGDTETLGVLARSAAEDADDIIAQRDRTLNAYFRTLRDHGVIRADGPLELQRYAFTAITTGFLMVDPIDPLHAHDHSSKADTLAATVHSAFEIPHSREDLHAAAARIVELYQDLIDLLQAEYQRRLQ